MSKVSAFNHPTFGPTEIVPSILAIKWATRSDKTLDKKSVAEILSSYSLTLAAGPGESEHRRSDHTRSTSGRDPRPTDVNQTEALSWVSTEGDIDEAIERLKKDDNVEWVSAVYRAVSADPGPQSYFAVNPTVLLLSGAAAAAAGDITSLDDQASVDQNRTKLLKGFVVFSLPSGAAIQAAERLSEKTAGIPNGVKLENIPFISPTTACSCSGAKKSHEASGSHRCSPAIAEIIPNDSFFPSQWGLQRINAPRAWPISEGDPNIVIAVLDQGVDLGHPDLNLWPISYSTITHTNNGSPVGNHGTACAGIIGGRIENALGVSGLAGKCKVMAISTVFADTQVAEGLYFAADNGARVVSMSFGVYPSWMIWDFSIIEAALQYCQDRNVFLVAAAGNENQNVCRFPGTDPRTLTVGGSNRDDVRKAVGDTSIEPFWGACFGPDVDVVAPCLEIPTTDRQGPLGYTPTDYDMFFDGTSAATPHVAALAGLILSVNSDLTNVEVRKIISETTDKINTPGYTYLPTGGKPFGTWNNQVGYGRINAERALLAACEREEECCGSGPCCVKLPEPDPCCVSPCDPPWRPDEQCMIWYETRFFEAPFRQGDNTGVAAARKSHIEFRITYEHKLCLLGKQHGPLLFTQTLLPGEKVTLYHSDRYRRITSEQDRYSIQTTFMQFLSFVHQGRVTNTLDVLSDQLINVKGSSSVSVGGGLAGLLGLPSGSSTTQTSVTDHTMVNVGFVSDQFNQSIAQASQLTHAERSVVVSNFEDKEVADVTARVIRNDNECRAVTYFIRKVVELYAVSTRVSDISYRIVAPNFPSDWHSAGDLGWLPAGIQAEIKKILALLPKIGDVVEKPRPISLPTDGTVYDPELAHCCSCEPERAAAIDIRLEKEKAAALKACLEAQLLEVELQRRRLLLQKGDLSSFDPVSPTPLP